MAGSAPAFAATYHIDQGSATCSDSGPGSVATPWCSTVQLAAIPSGSTVVLHAGSYDGFVLTNKQNVTIEAAEGERPELRGEVRLEGIDAANITLRNLDVVADGDEIGQVFVRRATDVLLEGLHLDRALFRSRGSWGLVIADSVVENGPLYTEATAQGIFCGCGVWAGPLTIGAVEVRTSNLTVRNSRFVNMAGDGIHLNEVVGSRIEGNYFHTSHPYGSGDHVDLIQAVKGADHVISGNEGYEWRHGILTTDDAPADGPDDDNRAMVVENNLVHTASGHAFNGAPGPNSLVVNNTWTGSEDATAKGASVKWTVGSNPGTTTSAGAVFANNIVDGVCACDDDHPELSYVANHIQASVLFAAGYELPAGSPAIDAADPAYAPVLDLRDRPRMGAPDMGALERDTAPPETTIDSGPPELTDDTSAAFEFHASEDATFQCRLDTGEWAACTSTQSYADLADGDHTFEVRATDQAGNQGAADSYSWRIDTVAPATTIDSGPPALTDDTSATFGFHADEDATFQCRLDTGDWTACESTYTDLADGRHTFRVRATDQAGHQGAAASHSWRIDTVAPATTIDSGPPALTDDTSATFGFHADEDATFQCRLDTGDWTACESTYTNLADGRHTFRVRATDQAGNQGAAASHSWTIDTVAPDTPDPAPALVHGHAALPGPAPPAGGTAARRAPARLRVMRVRVRRGRLVMRLRLHRSATGRLRVTYVSGGRRTRFAIRIPRRGGAWTVRRAVRGGPSGILRLRYAGNPLVQPGRVRVRIRAGKARMATRP